MYNGSIAKTTTGMYNIKTTTKENIKITVNQEKGESNLVTVLPTTAMNKSAEEKKGKLINLIMLIFLIFCVFNWFDL